MNSLITLLVVFVTVVLLSVSSATAELSHEEIENIVRRSYQYVAMYNVNNKHAMLYATQTDTTGWNVCVADEGGYSEPRTPVESAVTTFCAPRYRPTPSIRTLRITRSMPWHAKTRTVQP